MKKYGLVLTLILLFLLYGCGTSSSEEKEVVTVEIESTTTVAKEELDITVTEDASEEESTEEISAPDTIMETTELPEETIDEELTFSVTEEVAIKYAKQPVNVRSGPSTNYDIIDSLLLNQEIRVTGIADTGWYRIEIDGTEGYVSNNYLVDAPIEETLIVAVPTPTTGEGVQSRPDGNGNIRTLPCRATVISQHGMHANRETMMEFIAWVNPGDEFIVHEIFQWGSSGYTDMWIAQIEFNGSIGYITYSNQFISAIDPNEEYRCGVIFLD